MVELVIGEVDGSAAVRYGGSLNMAGPVGRSVVFVTGNAKKLEEVRVWIKICF